MREKRLLRGRLLRKGGGLKGMLSVFKSQNRSQLFRYFVVSRIESSLSRSYEMAARIGRFMVLNTTFNNISITSW